MRPHFKTNPARSLLMGLLLAASLGGCAASHHAGPQFTLISATCVPVDRTAPAADAVTSNEVTSEPMLLAFAPTFTATCRPDFEFTHLDLALAFIDNRSTVAPDMMPLFGSTASPGSRTIKRKPATLDTTVSAEPTLP